MKYRNFDCWMSEQQQNHRNSDEANTNISAVLRLMSDQ